MINTEDQVTESKALPPNTSAQKAEIIALTQALEMVKGMKINIWTDSKYAFRVVHVHEAVWKGRGLLSAQGKHIKHAKEILKLLEAVQLPEEVAIMHYKAHQRGNSTHELGNAMADREAKRVAEKGEIEVQSLVPDGKIQIDGEPQYSREDQELIEDLKGSREEGRRAKTPEGKIIVPSVLLCAIVMGEHRKSHWGAEALYKYLNQ